MEVSYPDPQPSSFNRQTLGRNLSFFLAVPVTAFVAFSLFWAVLQTNYERLHSGKIYTGLTMLGIDLSQKTPAEAAAQLSEAIPYLQDKNIRLVNPRTGQDWFVSPAELGMTVDVEQAVQTAYAVGRTGGPLTRFEEMFGAWYYGRSLPPTIILDEGKLEAALATVSQEIDRPSVNANLLFDGQNAEYIASQIGYRLDIADARTRLIPAMSGFHPVELDLLVNPVAPTASDTSDVAGEVQQMLNGPVTFYLQEPLDENDLQPVTLSQAELSSWLRIEATDDGSGKHKAFFDENALRTWLGQYETAVYREPVNARFYFDDNTKELVLVAPHINGRQLNIAATIARFNEQINTPNRSIPFIVDDIVPIVNSDATAPELGITELITETTTWFYGSTPARKHNIARSAANFFGIVIAPGEEFSFNKYLGTVSEADGFEEGLIIVGGRTIKGIGGGVCQVSTTIYQTAFLSGFPLVERWEHGYMLGYYNDGQGPGMDATVFSPIVDMRFINNTPYYLLMENYYNEEFQALTFKFYSTSMGRRVVKTGPEFSNIVPPPAEDRWEYDPELPEGTVVQIDWATEGSDVLVHRTVYNANGGIIIDEPIYSHYIPYPNVYHYGPGVEPYDYSKVPDNH